MTTIDPKEATNMVNHTVSEQLLPHIKYAYKKIQKSAKHGQTSVIITIYNSVLRQKVASVLEENGYHIETDGYIKVDDQSRWIDSQSIGILWNSPNMNDISVMTSEYKPFLLPEKTHKKNVKLVITSVITCLVYNLIVSLV